MDNLIKQILVQEFKTEVNDKASEIDPHDEYCWSSLTAGWALANGLSPDDANEFASYIRYNTDLG